MKGRKDLKKYSELVGELLECVPYKTAHRISRWVEAQRINGNQGKEVIDGFQVMIANLEHPSLLVLEQDDTTRATISLEVDRDEAY